MSLEFRSHPAGLSLPAFSLRGLAIDPPLLLAPMINLSTHAFRRLVRETGGCGLYYSEMLSARRVCAEPDESLIFKGFGREDHLMLQVLGDDPAILAKALVRLERFSPAGFDWNLGCTMGKITHWGGGAELLKTPLKTSKALAAMRRATQRPLTVKIRTPDEADGESLCDFVRMLESEGADGVIVHPRSPEHRFSRPARWDRITEVKSWLSVPVIGNGDIGSVDDALAMFRQTGCDGVMIGRRAVAQPYLFRDIAARLQGREAPTPPSAEIILEKMIANLGDEINLPKRFRELKTFCQYFAEGLPVPHWFWGPLQSAGTSEELVAKARGYFDKRRITAISCERHQL